jgi:hypothetical protein
VKYFKRAEPKSSKVSEKTIYLNGSGIFKTDHVLSDVTLVKPLPRKYSKTTVVVFRYPQL